MLSHSHRHDDPEWERLLLDLHVGLTIGELASVVVNETRRWLGCDRVTFAEIAGRRAVIRAATGQETVNPRASLVRRLAHLTGLVALTGDRFVYDSQSRTIPPPLEQPLADYLHESRSRLLVVAPLTPPLSVAERARSSQADDGKPRKHSSRTPTAALIIEQLTENPAHADMLDRLDRLVPQLAVALGNAQRHERILGLWLWDWLGTQRSRLRGRRLVKTIVWAIAAVVSVVALFIISWDYRVEAKGRLMPVNRRNVFAPWDGEVVELYVSGGESVNQGEPLVRLRNDELAARLLASRNELAEKKKQLLAVQAQLTDSSIAASRAEEIRLRGQLAQTQAEIEGAERQVEILARQETGLLVRAPIAGVVATFQVDQLLSDRPVRRGELLLEVMEAAGPWQLELEVPEYRVGHVAEAQDRLQARKLPVAFVLATASEFTFSARLESGAFRSEVSEKEGTVVEMVAALDSQELPPHRIGAEVTAKISCGKRSLGYVLFGDVIEFLRRRFWL